MTAPRPRKSVYAHVADLTWEPWFFPQRQTCYQLWFCYPFFSIKTSPKLLTAYSEVLGRGLEWGKNGRSRLQRKWGKDQGMAWTTPFCFKSLAFRCTYTEKLQKTVHFAAALIFLLWRGGGVTERWKERRRQQKCERGWGQCHVWGPDDFLALFGVNK